MNTDLHTLAERVWLKVPEARPCNNKDKNIQLKASKFKDWRWYLEHEEPKYQFGDFVDDQAAEGMIVAACVKWLMRDGNTVLIWSDRLNPYLVCWTHRDRERLLADKSNKMRTHITVGSGEDRYPTLAKVLLNTVAAVSEAAEWPRQIAATEVKP